MADDHIPFGNDDRHAESCVDAIDEEAGNRLGRGPERHVGRDLEQIYRSARHNAQRTGRSHLQPQRIGHAKTGGGGVAVERLTGSQQDVAEGRDRRRGVLIGVKDRTVR